ncbi:sensor histidine kinase [Anoxybacteroides tepidamans]|uniref:HAMP domain-containing sensor histidine kinase n=1 Tax=Anoxybacteroides tepidamans TaxID=265948 RepID=UPI00047F9FA6|nr:HAMP domain-containing sensor histidine kinase [Anoxybacillus tepidamans]
MKNKPLAIQIWLVFAGITIMFSICIAIFIFVTLRSFFMEETYRIIENAQINRFTDNLLEDNPIERDQNRQSNRSVNHIVFLPEAGVVGNSKLPKKILKQLYKQTLSQEEASKRYTRQIQGKRIYYVIRKGAVFGREVALVSYMWDSYLNELVRTLFRRLIFAIIIALLIISFPAAWLAKYLTRPLRQMDEHVKRIAEKDWHEPLIQNRKDEIGGLARSIEKMRKKLIQQDEAQKAMLQHISHELKTPVMVIRSYAESIEDGIFPKGSLEGSVSVIREEAVRLEKRVKDLLYLTKLDYYATQHPKSEIFYIAPMLEEIIERMRLHRPDVSIITELENDVVVIGDAEQWKIAFENLLDNQMRYARMNIHVKAEKIQNGVCVQFWNDGPPIDEHLLPHLFQKFKTGERGKFGLGLAIAERIARIHGAKIKAVNELQGVSFYVTFPIK